MAKVSRLFLLLVFSLLNASYVYAHGEEKPGPHGGYIRMPGTFHVELVPVGGSIFDIYLLDVMWKNPTAKNSKVEMNFKGKKATCSKKSIAFRCEFPKSTDLSSKGEIKIKATREGQKGHGVSYRLPLSFEDSGESHKGSH